MLITDSSGKSAGDKTWFVALVERINNPSYALVACVVFAIALFLGDNLGLVPAPDIRFAIVAVAGVPILLVPLVLFFDRFLRHADVPRICRPSPLAGTMGRGDRNPRPPGPVQDEGYDLFLAGPMACLPQGDAYASQRQDLITIAKDLRRFCGFARIYCPAIDISSREDFHSPDLALRRNLAALRGSRFFILFYPEARISSVTVEVGMAHALGIPGLLFVKDVEALPWILRDGCSVGGSIKVRRFAGLDDIRDMLRNNGIDIFGA